MRDTAATPIEAETSFVDVTLSLQHSFHWINEGQESERVGRLFLLMTLHQVTKVGPAVGRRGEFQLKSVLPPHPTKPLVGMKW